MVLFLGTIRPTPSLSCFAHFRRQISLKSSAISVSRNGFSPFRRFFQASLQSGKFCRSKLLSKARDFSWYYMQSNGYYILGALGNSLSGLPIEPALSSFQYN